MKGETKTSKIAFGKSVAVHEYLEWLMINFKKEQNRCFDVFPSPAPGDGAFPLS